jgi:O-antigen/teichoic acid export membrane protein
MSIRRQSIISSFVVYIGFALGFLNTYLFAKGFTEAQYGLTGTFVAIATVMFSFANLGMPVYIYKFFPYYNDNLQPEENDMITVALIVSIVGFVILMGSGLLFQDYFIRKYSANSPELVHYYYWLFPFGFGYLLYSILEAYAWQFRKSILTNFLKEILFRLLTTVLIVLTFTGVIKSFDLFIKIYSITYLLVACILLGYLVSIKKLHFVTALSRVTKKFRKKILTMVSFFWGATLVFNIAQVFDTLVIGAVVQNGMAFVGIYTLAQNVSSLVQAPQRAIIAAAIPPLSQAWKDKDLGKITRIYQRSSINMLIFAIGMFLLIWINFTDGVLTFHLKPGYLAARHVFLFIGITKVIDLGTGVNSQIIGSSNFWRFEFISGVILLALTLPLNYLLAKELQVIGPAISNLIAITIYNCIRYLFLLRKFNMQPFSAKTVYAVLLGAACYLVCHFLFRSYHGFGWICLRSAVFVLLYATGVIFLNLSPDVLPVWTTLKKRIGLQRTM